MAKKLNIPVNPRVSALICVTVIIIIQKATVSAIHHNAAGFDFDLGTILSTNTRMDCLNSFKKSNQLQHQHYIYYKFTQKNIKKINFFLTQIII